MMKYVVFFIIITIVLSLQEIHLKPSDKAKLSSYVIYRKDVTGNRRATGGVSLFVFHSLPYTHIPLNTNLQVVAVHVHIKKLITICTIYLSPNQTIQSAYLDNLLLQLSSPYILVGNFNAHSQLWGNRDSNQRGDIIEKIISDNRLCLLNNGGHILFSRADRYFPCNRLLQFTTHYSILSGTSRSLPSLSRQ